MPSRKINIPFFIAISLIVSLACNLSAGTAQPTQPSNAGSSSNALCDNDLYPVKQEATWTYLNTSSPSGDFSYTDTITEVRADGYTLTSQFTELTRTQEWLCEADGLKALQLGGNGAAASISTQGTSVQLNTFDVTGLSLPKVITPGMQWHHLVRARRGSYQDRREQRLRRDALLVNNRIAIV